ncbi:MAG: aminotransferase class I/II-fold pyridoxal phosphate-dependent enzyme [Acidobacteriota bacterium]
MHKRAVGELAVFGGPPLFQEPLHVGGPNLGSRTRLVERIEGIFDRNWLTNDGPLVVEFERRVAEYLGVRHCVAVCNGTAGIEIALRATGMSGEVIVPAFSFIATAHAVRWMGLDTVFCDIGRRTHTIDPAKIADLIAPVTSGIIGVHLWGRPCEIEEMEEIARARGLRLIFDAAHAFGCSHRGRMIGCFGDAEVFSFHATKVLNTGEGGAIVTDSDEIAERARLMRNSGFTGVDRVTALGTNAKMSELAAALGLTNLESIEYFIEEHRRCYERYRLRLGGPPGLTLLQYDPSERCNYQYVVAEVDADLAGIGRDRLVQVLRAENVLARRYFYPGCHRSMPYAGERRDAREDLAVTDQVAQRVITLPTGSAINDSQVDGVCGLLDFALAHAQEIEQRARLLAPAV